MRNYSNTAVETTIPLELDDVATQFTVESTAGWPVAPFTELIDPDLSAEEIVLVTAYTNKNVTVVRGWGGTTAVRHRAGARLRHGAVAEDFREGAMAFQHLFGDPVYDPNKPGTPPTNPPLVPSDDIVTKAAHTWADLLPANYVSPIPQGAVTP
jgi:hypothetical protein